MPPSVVSFTFVSYDLSQISSSEAAILLVYGTTKVETPRVGLKARQKDKSVWPLRTCSFHSKQLRFPTAGQGGRRLWERH